MLAPISYFSAPFLKAFAFSQGITEELYLPLLSILYPEMSDRNLVEVIAEFTGRDYYTVLNDVYRVGTRITVSPEFIEVILDKLRDCNYEEWLIEG